MAMQNAVLFLCLSIFSSWMAWPRALVAVHHPVASATSLLVATAVKSKVWYPQPPRHHVDNGKQEASQDGDGSDYRAPY